MVDENRIAFVEARLQGAPKGRMGPVAFRAALRVLPLIGGLGSYSDLRGVDLPSLYLSVFRLAQVSWASLRYPLVINEANIRQTARALSRAVDVAATRAGDSRYSKAADALVDAASSILRQDDQLSLRSLQNALQSSLFTDQAITDSLWREIEVDVERLATPDLRTFDPIQLLVSQRLWRSTRPRWHRIWSDRLFRELHVIGKQTFWHGWYEARQRGVIEFGLDPATAESLNLKIAAENADFWARQPRDIVADLDREADMALAYVSGSPRTVSEFALDAIRSSNSPINIADILKKFSQSNFPVVQKTLRGELSRLASAGLIARVGPGKYATISAAIERFSGKVEPQTLGAIQFEAKLSEPIRVRHRASTGLVRTDEPSRRRHAEICRRIDELLKNYGRSERGGNTSASIIEEIELIKDSLGVQVEEVDPDLLIPRGDGLRKDIAAYDARDDFTTLPPIPDTLLLSLRKIVSAYNNFVSFDPELTRRDEALLGPDAKRALVPPAEGQRAIDDAVAMEAAVPSVLEILGEEAKVAPSVPDPESRQSRRYSEGAKNFARLAIEKALEFADLVWRKKLTIGSGVAGTALASVGAARWVLANQEWLLRYLGTNPAMKEIIEELVRLLKNLPLA